MNFLNYRIFNPRTSTKGRPGASTNAIDFIQYLQAFMSCFMAYHENKTEVKAIQPGKKEGVLRCGQADSMFKTGLNGYKYWIVHFESEIYQSLKLQ